MNDRQASQHHAYKAEELSDGTNRDHCTREATVHAILSVAYAVRSLENEMSRATKHEVKT